MSTHNICFCAEIRKLLSVYPHLSGAERVIMIYATCIVLEKKKKISALLFLMEKVGLLES